ncbi:hypothetical protein [Microbacterium sp. Leaf436]|uniref:hypothetical protein n=1 Tax=Microbacterium sp. Leaf436 TaxID=1736377 RepID=UPI0006FF6E2A|nr:hypothetical protein [Microbacterium sp. Leaf436]KQT71224.1 hypothetical protein ASG45_15250 [Microbacterium sp. Leaf436]
MTLYASIAGDGGATELIVETGVRVYVSALGRFLQVDPVEGGVDNDYFWPTYLIGRNDYRLTGW